MFIINDTYNKKEIYKALNVPQERQKGAWNTGYLQYEGDYFIFANIGIPGRTGHDYSNYWDGDLLCWEGKPDTHVNMPSIQNLINGRAGQRNFIFTRTKDLDPFTFEGLGEVQDYYGERPVKIRWNFNRSANFKSETPETPGEVFKDNFWEGGATRILVNKYERDRGARRECIKRLGAICKVCEFDFQERYGALGVGFIHIHHIVPIASIKANYQVDPSKDLVPVCPNCHCMIHKKTPAYTVLELKQIIKKK